MNCLFKLAVPNPSASQKRGARWTSSVACTSLSENPGTSLRSPEVGFFRMMDQAHLMVPMLRRVGRDPPVSPQAPISMAGGIFRPAEYRREESHLTVLRLVEQHSGKLEINRALL